MLLIQIKGENHAMSRLIKFRWAPVALVNSFVLNQIYIVAFHQVHSECWESKMSNHPMEAYTHPLFKVLHSTTATVPHKSTKKLQLKAAKAACEETLMTVRYHLYAIYYLYQP